MHILGHLGMYFDAVVVEVKTFLLILLWPYCGQCKKVPKLLSMKLHLIFQNRTLSQKGFKYRIVANRNTSSY